MQVNVEETGALERRLTVQVPAEEVEAQIEQRLKEIGRNARIKGFRPGRVPSSVLRQRYGAQVRQEVFAQTVQSALDEALRQESLRPVVQPRFDPPPDPDAEGDIEFTAVVEIYPDIGPIDVSEIELSTPTAEVTEGDVDDMLVTLQGQRTEWETVERPPEEGDQVSVAYTAVRDDGTRVPAAGRHEMSIVIGHSELPEMEAALRTMQPGEAREMPVTFPDDYSEPELAGQSCTVDLKLTAVRSGELPAVDAEFVRSFGIASGDVDELRSEVRGNLERELRQAQTSLRKVRLVDALAEAHSDMVVPEGLVRQEAEGLQARAGQALQGQGEVPALEAFLPSAERRVRAGMLIGEVANQQGIRIDGNRVRATIEEIAATYEEPQEVLQLYYNDQRLLSQVENMVLEAQVVDWTLDNAKVKPEPMPFRELIAAAARSG